LCGGITHHHACESTFAASADDDDVGVLLLRAVHNALIRISRLARHRLGALGRFGAERLECFPRTHLRFDMQIGHQGAVFRVVHGNGQADQVGAARLGQSHAGADGADGKVGAIGGDQDTIKHPVFG